MSRSSELLNLKQFNIDNVVRSVLQWKCDFCGQCLLGDEGEVTADYARELVEANGPMSSTELIDSISFDFESGCCDRCSHFLQKDD